MQIPNLALGDLIAEVPIIQGGMGIGVSKANLAAAVANQGGVGIISGVQIGFNESGFNQNPFETNLRALKQELKLARKKSPTGIIGVNLMVAMRYFTEYVQAAVAEKADLIVVGAGLPLNLPALLGSSSIKIVPIVSSAKAARLILKRWQKQGRTADAIIVEGPLAGGHLGFKPEEVLSKSYQPLAQIVSEVIRVVQPFAQAFKQDIPVIAAGGISDGYQIGEFLSLGAAGVQMGTRFVATHECDAALSFKKAYVEASASDIKIINSPVGLPGRALNNSFLQKISKHKPTVKHCWHCLKHCNPATTPYCISQALINSVLGREGLIFCGAQVDKVTDIVSVETLMNSLKRELEQYLKQQEYNKEDLD